MSQNNNDDDENQLLKSNTNSHSLRENAQFERTITASHRGPHRRLESNWEELFVIFEAQNVKERSKYVWFEENMPFLIWNTMHALGHQMNYENFNVKHAADYGNLLSRTC